MVARAASARLVVVLLVSAPSAAHIRRARLRTFQMVGLCPSPCLFILICVKSALLRRQWNYPVSRPKRMPLGTSKKRKRSNGNSTGQPGTQWITFKKVKRELLFAAVACSQSKSTGRSRKPRKRSLASAPAGLKKWSPFNLVGFLVSYSWHTPHDFMAIIFGKSEMRQNGRFIVKSTST